MKILAQAETIGPALFSEYGPVWLLVGCLLFFLWKIYTSWDARENKESEARIRREDAESQSRIQREAQWAESLEVFAKALQAIERTFDSNVRILHKIVHRVSSAIDAVRRGDEDTLLKDLNAIKTLSEGDVDAGTSSWNGG